MAVSSRITRFIDAREEPVYKHLLPIEGYQHAPLVSLDEALEPIAQFFNAIDRKVWVAKKNCKKPKEGLKQDESASIHLYTMQFSEGPSFYQVLNQTLRAENREGLKPWFKFLKLFITALYKLPSHSGTFWRGVPGMDLSSEYPRGETFTWWGVSSCTINMEVLEADHFLGKKGNRTLFAIDCKNGKSVAHHSYFEDKEEEIILMPGSYFKVMSQIKSADGLIIIHLKEIDPPFPMMEPPFEVNEVSTTTPQPATTKKVNPAQAISFMSSSGKSVSES